MSDARDDRIQDYLDDRMDPAERDAFEREIAADAELAAEVEALRGVGDALRGLGASLPDGFHERARARFEAEHAERGRRFPWEALGLAAAALILGAILVPWSAFGPQEPALEFDTTSALRPPTNVGSVEVADEPVVAEAEARAPAPPVALREDTEDRFAPEPQEEGAPSAPIPRAQKKSGMRPPPTEPTLEAAGSVPPAERKEEASTLRVTAPTPKASRARTSAVAVVDALAAPRRQAETDAFADADVSPSDRFVPLSGPGDLDLRLMAPNGEAVRQLAPDLDWTVLGTVAGPADCAAIRIERDVVVRIVVPHGTDPGCLVRMPVANLPVTVERQPAP